MKKIVAKRPLQSIRPLMRVPSELRSEKERKVVHILIQNEELLASSESHIWPHASVAYRRLPGDDRVLHSQGSFGRISDFYKHQQQQYDHHCRTAESHYKPTTSKEAD